MASMHIDEAVPFVCAEEKDELAAAVGACGGEDADHEDDDAADMAPPPYQEGDDIDGGLCCYLCDDAEAKKWFMWHTLFEHVRRMHSVTQKELNGTYLHKMARAQLGEKCRSRYKARAAAKAGTTSCGAAPRSTDPRRAEAPVETEAHRCGDCNLQSPQHNGWKQVNCWVRYHADDTPVSPLECSLSDPFGQAVTANAAMDKEKAGEWVGPLPTVKIRQAYVDCDAPPPSKKGGRTKAWPVKIEASAVELAEFGQFLKTKKNMKAVGTNGALRGMSRVLDMLEVNGESIKDAAAAADPRILVSLYLDETYASLLGLSILDPAHTWTRKLLDSLKLYCEFQLCVLAKQQLATHAPQWGKYVLSIEQLLSELRGGFTQRVNDEKARRFWERRETDQIKITAIPSVESLQLAVHRGMLTLQFISEDSKGRAELSPCAQAAATVSMCGTLALNGYLGRKNEWQIATMEHVRTQVESGLDYIVCTNHETSRAYGNLAKWLAPGTIAAIRCYLQLPRRHAVKTFLCPVGEETQEVDIPRALRTFSARYLPPGTTSPTVNSLRKWYHTKLHALASKENTLLDVFTAIDAHFANVAKRHCILRGPEDDALLAKHLVHAMLGATVPWPSAQAIEEGAEAVVAIMKSFSELDCELRGGAAGVDAGEAVGDEDEVDDEELEWFENADCFGIGKHMEALVDAERVLPGAIADVGDGTVAEEKEAERERSRAPMDTVKTDGIAKERTKAKRDVNYKCDKTEKKDRTETKDATGTKRKAASDHVTARPMLPRMLFGAGAPSGMLSIWNDELNQQAGKACRVIDTCEDGDGEWAAIMADILSAPNHSHVAQVIESARHASARSSNEQA
jgi:hypothetical protein